ncbi:heat shock 70 kDa protein [Monomorium pharaonis]|uniref:heat shock 70 kDa protein n=1 Tax=Monomorium pharaonis TaxID=307658 RepID=UPI00102E12C5|nr:heat shock 70 kDa protein [Monomorium pharaonis]
MLVGARNKIAKENERNRKQTVGPVKRRRNQAKKNAVFFPIKFIFAFRLQHRHQRHPEYLEEKKNKKNEVMITNDKERLSREDIERMKVNEAERYHTEKQRERVAVKNKLKSHYFSMKSTVEERVNEKISEADRKSIVKKCNEIIKWIDNIPATEATEKESRKYSCIFFQFCISTIMVWANEERLMHSYFVRSFSIFIKIKLFR